MHKLRRHDNNRDLADLITVPFMQDDEHVARVVTSEWQEALLNGLDRLVKRGRVRELVANSVGAGVYEVRMVPFIEEGGAFPQS